MEMMTRTNRFSSKYSSLFIHTIVVAMEERNMITLVVVAEQPMCVEYKFIYIRVCPL